MGSLWLMIGLYSNFADSTSRIQYINIVQKKTFLKSENSVDCTLPSWQCNRKCKVRLYFARSWVSKPFWKSFGKPVSVRTWGVFVYQFNLSVCSPHQQGSRDTWLCSWCDLSHFGSVLEKLTAERREPCVIRNWTIPVLNSHVWEVKQVVCAWPIVFKCRGISLLVRSSSLQM